MIVVTAGLAMLAACAPRPLPPSPTPASDSASVAAVVKGFHTALRSGDSLAAIALLAPDVVVLESGGSERLAEYRAGHLPADIAFSRATTSDSGQIAVTVRGDVAWAWSMTRTRGEFRGRQIDSDGAELMVLERDADGWRIAAIHWSSRRHGP